MAVGERGSSNHVFVSMSVHVHKTHIRVLVSACMCKYGQYKHTQCITSLVQPLCLAYSYHMPLCLHLREL